MDNEKMRIVSEQVEEISKRGLGVTGGLIAWGVGLFLTLVMVLFHARFPLMGVAVLVFLVSLFAARVYESVQKYNSLLRTISPLYNEADYYKRKYDQEVKFNEDIKAKRDSWRKIVLDTIDKADDVEVPADLISNMQAEIRALKRRIEYLQSGIDAHKLENGIDDDDVEIGGS